MREWNGFPKEIGAGFLKHGMNLGQLQTTYCVLQLCSCKKDEAWEQVIRETLAWVASALQMEKIRACAEGAEWTDAGKLVFGKANGPT